MSLHRIFSFITAATVAVVAANARTHYDYTAIPMPGMPFTFTVDSIAMRNDVTRIYGHLYGTPHTSARIDGFFIQPSAKHVIRGT